MIVRPDSIRRLQNYLHSSKEPRVAIFDVGTRAIRLLVAPKQVPENPWERDTFFNDGILTNLGDDVTRYNQQLQVRESKAMRTIVQYMREYREILVNSGIAEEDISAIGTAVFRWIETNSQDVLSEIKRDTNLSIKVISEDEEAMFSLFSVVQTHGYRQENPDAPVKDQNDIILLLDQGGGSMEVSYVFPTDPGRNSDTYSFDDLGTLALRNDFFRLHPEKGPIDPEQNEHGIQAQYEYFKSLIANRIETWEGYPEILNHRIHAYGMGSAITRPIRGNNYTIHNQTFSAEQMREITHAHCTKLEETRGLISILFSDMKRFEQEKEQYGKSKEYDALDNTLISLCGLPVYEAVLRKFHLSELKICGYGLRYGYYVGKYKYMLAT